MWTTQVTRDPNRRNYHTLRHRLFGVDYTRHQREYVRSDIGHSWGVVLLEFHCTVCARYCIDDDIKGRPESSEEGSREGERQVKRGNYDVKMKVKDMEKGPKGKGVSKLARGGYNDN
jgi:hypothetical protein